MFHGNRQSKACANSLDTMPPINETAVSTISRSKRNMDTQRLSFRKSR